MSTPVEGLVRPLPYLAISGPTNECPILPVGTMNARHERMIARDVLLIARPVNCELIARMVLVSVQFRRKKFTNRKGYCIVSNLITLCENFIVYLCH